MLNEPWPTIPRLLFGRQRTLRWRLASAHGGNKGRRATVGSNATGSIAGVVLQHQDQGVVERDEYPRPAAEDEWEREQ